MPASTARATNSTTYFAAAIRPSTGIAVSPAFHSLPVHTSSPFSSTISLRPTVAARC